MNKADGAVDLAESIVKSACTLWAGPAGPIAGTIVDLIHAKVTGKLQQRRAERFFQDCIDVVAERLIDLIDRSGKKRDDTEIIPAIYAVRDTFDTARVTLISLVEADIDAGLLERRMLPARKEILSRALLNESGQRYYDLLLRESCAYAIELISMLPNYEVAAFAELLKRDTAILASLRTILNKLPDRRSVDDFNADYRRLVIRRLDRMQLFGAKLQSDYGRRYPLSVAYVSLGAVSPSTESRTPPPDPASDLKALSAVNPGATYSFTQSIFQNIEPETAVVGSSSPRGKTLSVAALSEPTSVAGDLPVEHWLAGRNRVLLIGEAGSGKSTLLQWLAVRAARQDFDDELNQWNSHQPFFIPLRRYAREGLPSPEHFPQSIGRNITIDMPQGWVQSYLRKGQALLLIDGLDELKEGKSRDAALQWLRDLIDDFPECKYVVTSRPGAMRQRHKLPPGFASLELRPMTPAKIRDFVERWHDAMRVELNDQEERDRLAIDQSAFLSALENDRHVRALCLNPLLCALLCALNRERHGHLPNDRMGVYRGALEMLLDARDRERGIASVISLSHDAKVTLLQDLAFYLVRNAWSDAPTERVREQLARSSRTLREVNSDPGEILQFLLERSGLLRTPSEGRIDFIHRSFQEYLAGKAAVDNDEIGYLLQHATDDQFWDVIVMAIGHALPWQAEEFLRGLLRQIVPNTGTSKANEGSQNRLKLLAVACLQTVRRLDPDLRNEINGLVADLLPPESFEVAPVLAAAGPVVLDLMAERSGLSPSQVAASIRVASLVGGHDAMLLISDLAAGYKDIEQEVIRAWAEFDPSDYASVVIPRMRWSGLLTVTEEPLLPFVSNLDGLIELAVPARMLDSPLFPSKPAKVQSLKVTNDGLIQLQHLAGWDELSYLEIHLSKLNTHLGPLSRFKALKGLRIVSDDSGALHLGPLAGLKGLENLQLAIPHVKMIRLDALSEMRDLTIYISQGVKVSRRSTPKNGFQLRVTDRFPSLLGSTQGRRR
jgi:hypothetical protein